MSTRKRLCKRDAEAEAEVEADEDAMSETSDGARRDDDFLLNVMSELISRSRVEVAGYV